MKKYLFGVLLGLVLIPTAFVSAQTGVVVTPVSSSIKTEYNASKPDQPWVISTHTVKVKTGAVPIYVSEYQGISLVHNTNKQTPGQSSSLASSTASVYAPGLYGGKAWSIPANSEKTFTYIYKWDSSKLFAGSYYSHFYNLGYVTNPSNTNDTHSSVSLSQKTNTIAIVGEKGPYISTTSPMSLTLGSPVTVSGERLSNSKVFLIPYYNLIPEGSPIELVIVSSSATNIVANVPNNILTGQYLLEIRNNTNGNSNRVERTVISGASISNVLVGTSTPSTWVQATSKSVQWTTTGSVPNVDVSVCYLRTGLSDACFFAYQNIANTGSVSNVRVGTNVPLNSMAYVKVRKAGTDAVMAKSSTFKVVVVLSSNLQVSDGPTTVGESIVIVDDYNDTEGVALLGGTFKAVGNSDVRIGKIPLTITTVGGASVASVVKSVSLIVAGQELASENVTIQGTSGVVTFYFSYPELAVKAGKSVDFIIRGDINDIESGGFDEGDTLKVDITEANVSSIHVVNQDGYGMALNQKIGYVLGKVQEFRTKGIQTTLVSTDTQVYTGTSNNDDMGQFNIKFKVRAIGDTVYLSSLANSIGYLYVVDKAGVATTSKSISGNITNVTGGDLTPAGNYRIEEGETETLSLTVEVPLGPLGTSGQYRLTLNGVKWDIDDDFTPDYTQTVNFQTRYTLLNKSATQSQLAAISLSLQSIMKQLQGLIFR
ncbi:MAG: hypothetical protein K8Q91_02985 [Candidatus Vogelbacteria bacterium]|nr:hypothetical protein [Candidatus Vogelbacteria bacterium]